MKILKLFSIDRWDGGDRCNHYVYADNKKVTEEYLAKNKFDSVSERTLVIISTMKELEEYKSGEIRQRAIAKLTEEERFVLGL